MLPADSGPSRPAGQPAPPPVNILLVDDQPRNLLALEAVLDDLGQNLVRAQSGADALRQVQGEDFAVILLDVQMDGLDGFTTARLIRQRDRSRSTPIIFLTAYESPAFPVAEAYRLGAVDYLVKPLVPEILRAKVAGFVELFQKTERLRLLERREYERRLAEERQRWQMERLREEAARERKIAEELTEADRRKDDFLAVLGHELRNPLAPLRNALEVLRLRGSDPATVEWLRGVLERQVGHLTRLVDDLLEISRMARGKITLQRRRLDLAALVGDTVEDHRRALEGADLGVALERPPDPVWVEADPTRLTQVVGNLLTNAGKFTDRGGRVTVRVAAEPGPGRAVVAVRDTGIGIEPEMLPRVFDPFAQADPGLDRDRGGLGLGLALVKGLVRLHGGGVQAASAGQGQGAELTFWLPLAAEPGPQTAAETPSAAAAPRLKVLVIEDNHDAAESLRLLLELHGHQVLLAGSGTEGIEAARRSPPDVVLCDLGLPGMDGFAVARALRGDPRTGGARLIAVSGYGHDDDLQRGREAGFNEHVLKPVDPAELQRIVSRPIG
jgi:signal transduction histidine kinase